jgi:hypothetical protein
MQCARCAVRRGSVRTGSRQPHWKAGAPTGSTTAAAGPRGCSGSSPQCPLLAALRYSKLFVVLGALLIAAAQHGQCRTLTAHSSPRLSSPPDSSSVSRRRLDEGHSDDVTSMQHGVQVVIKGAPSGPAPDQPSAAEGQDFRASLGGTTQQAAAVAPPVTAYGLKLGDMVGEYATARGCTHALRPVGTGLRQACSYLLHGAQLVLSRRPCE